MLNSQSAPALMTSQAQREQLKQPDKYGTRSFRCNARPINPFATPENAQQEIIGEVS
jgi:hypothetical protein